MERRVGANMDYESMLLLFRICIYLIAFVVFIIIVKFGLKKRLDYGRVAIAGFIIGMLFAIILVVVGYITYNPDNPNYAFELYMDRWPALAGGAIGEGIITLVAFVVLYAIAKPVYNKLRR